MTGFSRLPSEPGGRLGARNPAAAAPRTSVELGAFTIATVVLAALVVGGAVSLPTVLMLSVVTSAVVGLAAASRPARRLPPDRSGEATSSCCGGGHPSTGSGGDGPDGTERPSRQRGT